MENSTSFLPSTTLSDVYQVLYTSLPEENINEEFFYSTENPMLNFSLSNITSNTSSNTPNARPPIFVLPFNIETFKLFMAVLYGLIFLVGVPGNVLVILTIVRVPKMRTIKNILIGNLAIGDLANILWCLPTSLLSLYVSWPYGDSVCKYLFPVADVVIGNTIFTMVLIAIDRYRAIVMPLTEKPTLRKIVVMIILIWVLSYVLMGLPLVTAAKVSRGFWVKLSCNLHWINKLHEISYRLITFICLFCLPFTVVLICFLRIKNKLIENIRFASRSVRGKNTLARAKRHQRLIKMLLVIFLCFTSCFLPVNLLILTITFYPKLVTWKYAAIVVQLAIALLFLNSTMNPIILYLLSHDYRLGYLQQIKCFCPNSRKVQLAVSALRRLSTSSVKHNRRQSRADTILSVSDVEYYHRNNSTRDEELNIAKERLLSTKFKSRPVFSNANLYQHKNGEASLVASGDKCKKSVTWCKNGAISYAASVMFQKK